MSRGLGDVYKRQSEIVEDNINNVYQIKAIACYQQTSAIVITVYDYDTFQAMRKYLGC